MEKVNKIKFPLFLSRSFDGEKKCVFTGMSMVLSNWIITPIKVGCKSRK